jgi:hypothetical protein
LKEIFAPFFELSFVFHARQGFCLLFVLDLIVDALEDNKP